MKARRIPWLSLLALSALVPALAGAGFAMKPERAGESNVPAGPMRALGAYLMASEPLVLTSGGDTTWIQVHSSSNTCPGDPYLGHGGEATGGPGAAETWCLEEGPGDSCGTISPWDANCFKHVDVRALPSVMNINYWHIDSYRTDQRAYCGSRALWCGSPAEWEGQPVECGTWQNPPGYGEQWHCIVQLSLPAGFSVAAGCTLYFDPRYDTECKYDYFYLDYYKGGTGWMTLATFNTTSNNPGGTCNGTATPDYFANTDVNRLTNCNWQQRVVGTPGKPAFRGIIMPTMWGTTVSAPMVRWRFASDASWDDADGNGNTDGAAWVDNVAVYGSAGSFYAQDFETCAVFGPLPQYWSLENPPGVTDQWHISHDPDPPYEGGDGGTRTACLADSSWVWRARPENGYPSGKAWRNGWYYRLMTPRVPVLNSGCVVQYDYLQCSMDVTCDYPYWGWRFYDSDYGKWCPWDRYYSMIGPWCMTWWAVDEWDDLSSYYDAGADSMQFCWELIDASQPTDPCRGKHTGTEFLVDNVSVGFYDLAATRFIARGIDLLHDTFFTTLCAYNSLFDVYDPDTVNFYSGGVAIPWEKRLVVSVWEPDGVDELELVASLDRGATWVAAPMILGDVWIEGWDDYAGTVCPGDFGLTEWPAGTEVWYCVRATDFLANVEYFPAKADPASPGHTGGREDYLEFSILPMAPDTVSVPRILLVDGYGRRAYDYAPCLADATHQVQLERIYGQTLAAAGYCYDKFDVSGAGSNLRIHPVDYGAYDAVVWFTGPYSSNWLIDGAAQRAIRDYLAAGGKVLICGDRVAYDMAVIGEDSLGGEFLGGVLGAVYQQEMESALTKPYLYLEAVDTLQVMGAPVAIGLDSMLVYRECPDLKDMSYVLTNASPPAGYTAQPLMYLANPTVTSADEAMYVEYQSAGQCVFVNFDLCASVNHTRGYCSGDAAGPAPDFAPGTYDGRVELVRVILEDIFGLPSGAGGEAGAPGVPGAGVPAHSWALAQNSPNPSAGSTEIAFEVALRCRVSVRVFNVAGQLVRTLADEPMDAGRHGVSWDGRDRAGAGVASGVYFYTMEAGPYKATKKMLVVR